MLQKLYVDNYKSLVNFELELKPLGLLLGRNGVGKSAVLDVVFAVRQLLSGEAKVTDQDVFPPTTLTRWQDRVVQILELTAVIEQDTLIYRLEIEHDPDQRRGRIIKETLAAGGKPLFSFHQGEVQLFKDDHSKGPAFRSDWTESGLARVAPVKDNVRLSRFLDWARKILVCGLYPRSFVTETRDEDPVLERDGRNFAAWYRHVFQERQDLVPGYTDALKEVLSGFEGVNLEKAGRETRAFMARFREQGRSFTLALHELSDGQRALLAIYALVHLASGQGYTLFLDEPDNYVASVEIQPWLHAVSAAAGDTIPQVLICSHHPELIDYFPYDRTKLIVREDSGATRVLSPGAAQVPVGVKLSEWIARGWTL